MPGKAVGLAAPHGTLAVAYTNHVEPRQAAGFVAVTNHAVAGMKDVTFAPDGSLWGIVSNVVTRLPLAKGSLCPEVAKPTAITFDEPNGFLAKPVGHVNYDEKSDTLYVSGYLKGESEDSWGVTGKTPRRYDG